MPCQRKFFTNDRIEARHYKTIISIQRKDIIYHTGILACVGLCACVKVGVLSVRVTVSINYMDSSMSFCYCIYSVGHFLPYNHRAQFADKTTAGSNN